MHAERSQILKGMDACRVEFTAIGTKLATAITSNGGNAADVWLVIERARSSESAKLIDEWTVIKSRILAQPIDAAVGDDDPSSYVPASKLKADSRLTQRKFMAAIKEHGVRTRKPSPQRLTVHAGDWMRCTAAMERANFNVLDSIDDQLASVEFRKQGVREHKTKRVSTSGLLSKLTKEKAKLSANRSEE